MSEDARREEWEDWRREARRFRGDAHDLAAPASELRTSLGAAEELLALCADDPSILPLADVSPFAALPAEPVPAPGGPDDPLPRAAGSAQSSGRAAAPVRRPSETRALPGEGASGRAAQAPAQRAAPMTSPEQPEWLSETRRFRAGARDLAAPASRLLGDLRAVEELLSLCADDPLFLPLADVSPFAAQPDAPLSAPAGYSDSARRVRGDAAPGERENSSPPDAAQAPLLDRPAPERTGAAEEARRDDGRTLLDARMGRRGTGIPEAPPPDDARRPFGTPPVLPLGRRVASDHQARPLPGDVPAPLHPAITHTTGGHPAGPEQRTSTGFPDALAAPDKPRAWGPAATLLQRLTEEILLWRAAPQAMPAGDGGEAPAAHAEAPTRETEAAPGIGPREDAGDAGPMERNAEALAALVNEALVEQARRHGVDLA